jgi:hypothetical protein
MMNMRFIHGLRRAEPFAGLRPAEKVLIETYLDVTEVKPGTFSWNVIADPDLLDEFAYVALGGGPEAWKRHLRKRRVKKAAPIFFIAASVFSGFIKPLLDGVEAARIAVNNIAIVIAFAAFVITLSWSSGFSYITFLFGLEYSRELERFARRLKLIAS